MKRLLTAVCVLPLLSVCAYAQSNAKKAEYFSAQDIQKMFAGLAPQAQSSGSSGSTITVHYATSDKTMDDPTARAGVDGRQA